MNRFLKFYTYGTDGKGFYEIGKEDPPLPEIGKVKIYTIQNISPDILCGAFYWMKGFELSKLTSNNTQYDAKRCAIFHQPQSFHSIWDIVDLKETDEIKKCTFSGIYHNEQITAEIDFERSKITLRTETREMQEPLCDFIEKRISELLNRYKNEILIVVNMQSEFPFNITEYKIFREFTMEDVEALCDQLDVSGFFAGTYKDKNKGMYLIDGLSAKGMNALIQSQNK